MAKTEAQEAKDKKIIEAMLRGRIANKVEESKEHQRAAEEANKALHEAQSAFSAAISGMAELNQMLEDECGVKKYTDDEMREMITIPEEKDDNRNGDGES